MSTTCVPITETIYKDQSLFTIRLNTRRSLVGVTDAKILYKKPDGTKGEWEATVDGQEIVYEVQAGDIDQQGPWDFQAYIAEDDRVGLGNIVTKYVECNLEP